MKKKTGKKLLCALAVALCMTGSVVTTQLIPVQASSGGQILEAAQDENVSGKNDTVNYSTDENGGHPLPPCGYDPERKADAAYGNSGQEASIGLFVRNRTVQSNAAGASENKSGTYGTVKWTFSGDTLTITGTGAMPDSTSDQAAPWSTLNVSKVIIGEGITSVGAQDFADMGSVTSVSFPKSLTSIGEAAFFECSGITAVNLPSGVKTVESGAFANCRSLKDFSAPGVTSFGDYVLQNTALTSFEIPKGVTAISTIVFYGNNTLENYTVAQGNTAYTAKDGVVYSKDSSTLVMYPCDKSDAQFTIPSGVKTIGKYAFYNTRNLASVNFSNVEKLGEGAFFKSSLSGELVISDKITEADYFTFESCYMITSVRFGTGLKESSYSMFQDCTGIKTIDFGGLGKLGMRTFLGCEGLVEVTLPDRMTEWGGSVFTSCSNLETFISKGLTEIWYADFAQCYALKNVELSKVEKINRQAFANCPSLKKITLPASTQWVNANAFEAGVEVECLNKELVKYGRNGLHYAETINISGTRDYKKAFEVLAIVNEKRKANGRSALTMDNGLLETAMVRAGEQAVLFSHTRPDGSSCFTANADMVAENVAIGQNSASSVMTSWMNSEGHKENILLEDAKTIGIGCFYINGVYTWVQCFGTKSSSEPAKERPNQSITQAISIPRDTFGEAEESSGIIWGDRDEYTYKISAVTDQSKFEPGKTTQVRLMLTNPGFNSRVPFSGSNTSWSSSNTSVAKTDGKGNVSFVGSGSVTITGKTKYYQASVKLTAAHTAVTDKAVAPTLTKNGKTAGSHCKVCGQIIKEQKPIAKLLNISKAKVTGLTSKTYTGGKIKPSFKVYYGKTLLKNGTDYTVGYGSNKSVGKGYVTITGKGKYGGKITKTFSILPRKTAVSAKSTKRGKLCFSVTKRSEATKYQIQYATNSKFKSAKTLTTTSLKPVVSASSKKTYYVRVRTVRTVGKTNYYSGWSSVKKVTAK